MGCEAVLWATSASLVYFFSGIQINAKWQCFIPPDANDEQNSTNIAAAEAAKRITIIIIIKNGKIYQIKKIEENFCQMNCALPCFVFLFYCPVKCTHTPNHPHTQNTTSPQTSLPSMRTNNIKNAYIYYEKKIIMDFFPLFFVRYFFFQNTEG